MLSRKVNYNQVVVKCQILQKCFLQNFNMQKFQNMEHSNSRTFKGLEFFSKFKDFSRTLWTLFNKKSKYTLLPDSLLITKSTHPRVNYFQSGKQNRNSPKYEKAKEYFFRLNTVYNLVFSHFAATFMLATNAKHKMCYCIHKWFSYTRWVASESLGTIF